MWHFADGAWTRLPVPEPLAIWDLLRTSDGTLWATLGTLDRSPDDPAPYVLRGTEWTRVGTGSADLLAVDRKGVVWVAESDSTDPSVVAVRSLGVDGRTWSESAPTPSTDLVYQVPGHLAVGRDGAIWVGASVRFPITAPPAGWNLQSGLTRYLDGRWEPVRPRDGSSPFAVLDLTVAPNGDVWVVGADVSATDPADPTDLGTPWIARFDGTRWAAFGQDGGFPEPGQQPTIAYVRGDTLPRSSVAAGPDGTIWVATTSGLARFDGVTWTTLLPGVVFSVLRCSTDRSDGADGDPSAGSGATRIPVSRTTSALAHWRDDARGRCRPAARRPAGSCDASCVGAGQPGWRGRPRRRPDRRLRRARGGTVDLRPPTRNCPGESLMAVEVACPRAGDDVAAGRGQSVRRAIAWRIVRNGMTRYADAIR